MNFYHWSVSDEGRRLNFIVAANDSYQSYCILRLDDPLWWGNSVKCHGPLAIKPKRWFRRHGEPITGPAMVHGWVSAA